MAGSSVTLAARGITDSIAPISAVFFSWDSNYNGQCNVGDTILGSTTTLAGGVASLTVSTSGMAPGTYRYFAGAVDANGQWSNAATATLTVLPGDDYGDNAATAAAIGAPSSTHGALGVAGDVDWFKFQAVAGKTYTISTQLGTLRDSVLYLYDGNGTTLLAQDDDGGDGLASRIQWTAPATGTYYLDVAAYANSYAGSYTLDVQVQNVAPVLAIVADQTMSHTQTSLSIPLGASDADGDSLNYNVAVLAIDPLTQKAYNLDQQLGLYQWGGSYFTNLRGCNEKYLTGTTNGTSIAYFILPSGRFIAGAGASPPARWSIRSAPNTGPIRPSCTTLSRPLRRRSAPPA